jgi:hypothetical protein
MTAKASWADRLVWRDVIGTIEIALVDLAARNEAIYLDRVIALDRDRVEVFILDHQISVFGVFVAAALVRALDGVARHLIDELLTNAIAGLLVDLPEGDPLARRRSGVERDRAGNEASLM